jgi:hypothetical protein
VRSRLPDNICRFEKSQIYGPKLPRDSQSFLEATVSTFEAFTP